MKNIYNYIKCSFSDAIDLLRRKTRPSFTYFKRNLSIKTGIAMKACAAVVILLLCSHFIIHFYGYTESEQKEATALERKWHHHMLSLEAHARFVAITLSSVKNEYALVTINHLSPYKPEYLHVSQKIVKTPSKDEVRDLTLRVMYPLDELNHMYVIDIPLKSLAAFMGVQALIPDNMGALHSKWGNFKYTRLSPSLWKSFYTERVPLALAQVMGLIVFLFVFFMCHVHGLFVMRRHKCEELTKLRDGLYNVKKQLEDLLKEESFLKETLSLRRNKDILEEKLSRHIDASQRHHIEKILAFATLLYHETPQNPFAQELLTVAKQLNAGEIDPASSDKVNLLDLLNRIKELAALDLLNAHVALVIHESLKDVHVNIDERLCLIYLLCFFKKMMTNCFKETEIFVTKHEGDSASFSVTINGRHVDGSLALFEKDIVIGGVRFSQKRMELIREKLCISLVTTESQCVMTFHTPLNQTQDERPSHGNIIPLFA